MKHYSTKLLAISLAATTTFWGIAVKAAGTDAAAHPAQMYRAKGEPVVPMPDGTILCEAEEFQVAKPAKAGTNQIGWQAKPWGENYYAATFANTFLSRKAFLGAPDNCDETMASINVTVTNAGRYLVLVRYEAAYRFETQFRVKVEQNGKVVLDRLYGARDNLKIWAFGEKLKKEVAWSWGAVENVVWEGHDAYADLQPGSVKITLTAGKQPEPQAKRNVDLVMLTRDEEQVKMRIEKETYLPLDGMLLQAGDVWVRVINGGAAKVKVTGGMEQEHSPYWVHIRNWKPAQIEVEAGKSSDWVEVGGTMDTLNDGQWRFESTGACKLEFGLKGVDAKIKPLRTIDITDKLQLVSYADTRYCQKIQTPKEAVADLQAYLKSLPVRGKAPSQTFICAYSTIMADIKDLYGLSDIGKTNGYIDVRGMNPSQLVAQCKALSADARRDMKVVSLGDEIGLPAPEGAAAGEGFAAFLKTQGVTPKQVDPAAGDDWSKIKYNPDPKTKESAPGLYYWSKKYLHHYGIKTIKELTDTLRPQLPNAGIGANFSPHGPVPYLGEAFKWVTCFREGGMTMPWSEDYIWQLPVGTPQMNSISLDLFRAGLRGKPDSKIMFYVMAHSPGNTPNMWRRQFYGDIAHGMKAVNLYELNPVWVAYTENHVTGKEIYGMILKTLRELSVYEDIVQAGQRRQGEVGLWFSETGDIWLDAWAPFAAAKRALYIAILHTQIPLDVLVDQDAADKTLNQYKVLYLADRHISQASSAKIADWVKAGGKLFATAGAGMFDEYDKPNTVLRELLGVEQTALDIPADQQVNLIKQDLPFTKPMDTVKCKVGDKEVTMPIFGARSRITLKGAEGTGTFGDGSPAMTVRKVGKGEAIYCAFLPGLSYFKPAIPLRPVDRGSSDDAMSHFIPSQFDAGAAQLVASAVATLTCPVICSEPLVEATVIESKAGKLIPLVNWSGKPVQNLKVTFNGSAPKKAELASGGKVQVADENEKTVYTLDLDVADALILR